MNFDCFRLLIFFSFVFPLWLSSVHLKPFFRLLVRFKSWQDVFLFAFLSSPYQLNCLHFKFSFFRAIIFKSSLILSVLFTISIYVHLYTFVIALIRFVNFLKEKMIHSSQVLALRASIVWKGQILENVGGIFKNGKSLSEAEEYGNRSKFMLIFISVFGV